VGDTVISRNGRDLMTHEGPALTGPPAPGDSVILVVRRAGQTVRLRLIVGELRPGPDGQLACVPRSAPTANPPE
jgi:hypothetical protein